MAVIVCMVTSADAMPIPRIDWLVLGRDAGIQIPPPVPMSSYRIVYHVSQYQAPDSTEEVDVARPYSGRYLQTRGSSVLDGWLTNSTGGWFWDNGGWSRVGTGEQRAAYDYDLTPALQVAIRMGDARVIGRQTVLGRTCTVVRTGAPIGDPLAPPTARDHDDICVDSTGVALTDSWVYHSKLLQVKTATLFQPGASLPSSTFVAEPSGPLVAPQELSGVTSAAPAGDFRHLGYVLDPPAGFRPDGGYQTLPLSQGQPSGPASFTENFVDAGQLIELRQWPLGQSPASGSQARPGTLAFRLPQGEAHLDIEMNDCTLSITTPRRDVVMLLGNDPAQLLLAAQGLKRRR